MSEPFFHHLLDYRSGEFLARMDNPERARLVEELGRLPPSKEAWGAICELFARWPSDDERAAWLTLMDRKLAAWDDELRFAYSSNGFLYSDQRTVSPVARLARSVEIYRREEWGDTELSMIANSEYFAKLTRLTVFRSEIGAAAWNTLWHSPFMANLRHLDVAKTTLGGDVWRAEFPKLVSLRLSDVGLSAAELEPARIAMPFPELRRLDLSNNLLADAGAELLALSPSLAAIEHLNLERNFIKSGGARALLASPHGCSKRLDLTNNSIAESEKPALTALAAAKGIEIAL